jgi:hypothetical protein
MTNHAQKTSSHRQPTKTVDVSFPPPENRQPYLSPKNKATIARVLALKKSHIMERGIKFAEEVEIYEITPLREAYINDMFYSEDALADMRYEAFMEKCGLDVADFD